MPFDVAFLSPSAGLVALLSLFPLVALALASRRATRVRVALRLPGPRRTGVAPVLLSVAALAALLGLAAAQPVVAKTQEQPVRDDVEAFVVLDSTRSMLARADASSSTRFERAAQAALRFRERFPAIPFGLASLTDRVLPHLLPTSDRVAYSTTLARALGVERPPPSSTAGRATDFAPIASLATRGFFSDSASRRIAIVLTDGESLPVNVDAVSSVLHEAPPLTLVFVRFWGADEHVYRDGEVEDAYRADAASGPQLARVAAGIGGRTFDESEVPSALDAVASVVGETRAEPRATAVRTTPLAAWAVGLAFVPLATLLWRRNRP
jgi:hypothetical protein